MVKNTVAVDVTVCPPQSTDFIFQPRNGFLRTYLDYNSLFFWKIEGIQKHLCISDYFKNCKRVSGNIIFIFETLKYQYPPQLSSISQALYQTKTSCQSFHPGQWTKDSGMNKREINHAAAVRCTY